MATETKWKWNTSQRNWTATSNGVPLAAQSVEPFGTRDGRRPADPRAWKWSAGDATGFAPTGEEAKRAAMTASVAQ